MRREKEYLKECLEKAGIKNEVITTWKRLQLKTPADQLYPEDYDFSIVFDSVENRKARHQMEKRHEPGLEIRLEEF